MMNPAKEVGGDFYDFYFLDDSHLAITVADVSDKGVPAALFMVITKTLLKENLLFAGDSMKLGKVFEETNDTLVNSNEENMFVTVFSGVLDTNTGNFVYVNAGHNPPIIKRDGNCSYLEKADYPVMGAIEGLPYNVSMISLKKGDSLFLYTDGVTEAMNTERKLFGEQRLLNALKISAGSAENDINKVYATVKEYAGSAVQSDDITMLEIIYNGSKKKGMTDLNENS
jgi:sigma-B regulation protein RsbU (phosphoserine phosphatase)